MPFTPGGAGVQQALLVEVFAASAPTAVVAAYSVGQQIAIAAFTASLGLAAIFFIFRFRSFGEVLHAGRASRDAERAAEREWEHESPDDEDDEHGRGGEDPPPGRRGGTLPARY